MRFTPRCFAVTVSVAAVFGTAACGHASKSDPNTVPVANDAPGYCQQLAKVPAGLKDAVVKAVAGAASDADKTVISAAITQLTNAAKDSSAPADMRAELTGYAAVLGKLSAGKKLNTTDVKIIGQLGGMVNDKCVRSN